MLSCESSVRIPGASFSPARNELCYKNGVLPENLLQDLNDSTQRVFGVEGPFIFKTSTLDICQGRTVAIHESAWESVRSFVAELQVTLANGKGRHQVFPPPLND